MNFPHECNKSFGFPSNFKEENFYEEGVGGKLRTMKEIKSWGKSLLVALGIVMILRTFLFDPYIVEGSSMEPTLHNQERIFVEKFYLKDSFKRGEIVVIKGTNEDKNYVKRIIGLPGDTVEFKDDKLYVNRVLINEPYLSLNRKAAKQISSRLTGDYGPITVPADEFFVMGDNRLYSMDSRNGLGFIQKENIIGKSEFVLYPFDNIRNIK